MVTRSRQCDCADVNYFYLKIENRWIVKLAKHPLTCREDPDVDLCRRDMVPVRSKSTSSSVSSESVLEPLRNGNFNIERLHIACLLALLRA